MAHSTCEMLPLNYTPPLSGTDPLTTRWVRTRIGTTGSVTPLSSQSDTDDGLRLAVAATSEAQSHIVSFGDVLNWKPTTLHYIDFMFRVPVAITTNEYVELGIGSAHNATADNMTNNLWLRLEASMSLLVEWDNNTTDTDDQDTLIDLTADQWYNVRFAFSASPDYGWAKDVQIYMTKKYDSTKKFAYDRTRLLSTSQIDVSAFSYIQPYFRVGKASGTTTPAVDVAYFWYKNDHV